MARLGMWDPKLTKRGWFGTHYADPLNGFFDRTFVGGSRVRSGVLASYESYDYIWLELVSRDDVIEEFVSVDSGFAEWTSLDGIWRA